MDVSVLKGKTLASIMVGDNVISFVTTEGDGYQLYHYQDCCESVYIESIVGELQDLVGNPLLVSEEVSSGGDIGPVSEYDDAYQWTFYKFATIKGYVDIRWCGSSNGYYSTSVDFEKV